MNGLLVEAMVYLAAGVASVPIAKRLGLGSVLGYLIAGVAVGPYVLNLAGDPAVAGTPTMSLRYRRPPGYRPTDAALLPAGRILILNRRFAWLRFSVKLLVADVRGVPAGGIIEGQEVAVLEAPLVIDNMEGLSVTQENGRTIVWIVSDDDFMRMFRRTLLLKFELRL